MIAADGSSKPCTNCTNVGKSVEMNTIMKYTNKYKVIEVLTNNTLIINENKKAMSQIMCYSMYDIHLILIL